MQTARFTLQALIVPAALAIALTAPAGYAATAANAPTAVPESSTAPAPKTTDIRRINQIARAMPKVSPGISARTTAECIDGTYSSDKDVLAACSYHGGIARWFGAPPDRGIDGDGTQIAATRG